MPWNTDLWWLKRREPQRSNTFEAAYQLARQEKQADMDRRLREESMRLEERTMDLNFTLKEHRMKQEQEDAVAMNQDIADVSPLQGEALLNWTPRPYHDPAKMNAIAAIHRNRVETSMQLSDERQWTKDLYTLPYNLRLPVITALEASGGRRTKEVVDAMSEAHSAFQSTGAMTSTQKNIEAAASMEAKAQAAEQSGNIDTARVLREQAALLKASVLSPTETITVGTDAEGKPTVNVTKGPTSGSRPTGSPTTTVQSSLQAKIGGAQQTIALGTKLLDALRSKDVGLAGNVNQVVINELLGQFFPNMKVGGVTEARTLMGSFNENVMKSIASDPRISDLDRKRLEALLPSMGNVESIDSAKKKIHTFLSKIREDAVRDSKSLGLPPPEWAMPIESIAEKVSSGEWTREKAKQILRDYHPDL